MALDISSLGFDLDNESAGDVYISCCFQTGCASWEVPQNIWGKALQCQPLCWHQEPEESTGFVWEIINDAANTDDEEVPIACLQSADDIHTYVSGEHVT